MAYMQNKQMPIRNYGALRNMMLAQNTAPNPYRSRSWIDQIAQQKALEDQLMKTAPNATPQDLQEFGLDSQGRITPNTFGPGSTWRELEGLQPSGIDPTPYERELERIMQERQNQSLRYPTPAERDAIRRSGNPFTPSQRDSIWNEMKNWR